MPQTTFRTLLDHLRRTWATQAARDLSDRELLERFLADHEDAAFAVLVQRHGPMVFGVCQRMIGDTHIAEDAFQGTFLVLARRAGSIKKQGSIASWLYGVAQHVALKARAQTAAGRRLERRMPDMSHHEPLDEMSWQELRGVLDEEIGRLPQKYRAPIVLCYLEGKSQERAAEELHWAKGTLARRLARGRELLRSQLVGRGIALSAGGLAVALAEKVTAAPLATVVTLNTVKAVSTVLAGKAAVVGCVSPRAVALAQDTLHAMFSLKAKLMAVVLMFTLTLGGAGWAAYSTWADKTPADMPNPVATPAAPQEQKQKSDAEKFYFAMEKKLRSAKSLKVVFTTDLGEGDQEPTAKGTIMFAEGNRARCLLQPVKVKGKDVPEDAKLLLISDGKQMVVHSNLGGPVAGNLLPDATPDRFNTTAATLVARSGALLGCMLLAPPGFLADPQEGVEKSVLVSDFKLGAKEQVGKREAQIVEYTLVLVFERQGRQDFHVKLWVDPKTMLPIQRFLEGKTEKGGMKEVYTEVVIDPKLEAKLFELPPSPTVGGKFPTKADVARVKKAAPGKADLFGDPLPDGAIARLGTVRFRPGSRTEAVTFLPGGDILATDGGGGFGSQLQFWDAAEGLRVQHFANDRGSILAFSPDCKMLFAERLSLIDVATGKELRRFRDTGDFASTAAFSPDNKFVAAGENRRGTKITVWDVTTGKEMHRLETNKNVWSVAFSADSKILASASDDKMIRLWDVATGKEIRRLEGSEGAVTSVAFAPAGNLLASTGEDGMIRLWDSTTGQMLRQFKAEPPTLRVLGKVLLNSMLVAFAPGGKVLASAGRSGSISLWDPDSGKELRRWQAHSDQVRVLAFSPDATKLASVAGNDHALRLWDVATGKPLHAVSGHTGSVEGLRFTADGKALLSSGADRQVLEWDLATGKPRRQLWSAVKDRPDGAEDVYLGSYTADGKLVAVIAKSITKKAETSVIHIWDVAQGKVVHTFKEIGNHIMSARFTPDGKFLGAVGDDLRLWEVAAGKQVRFVEGGQHLAFSADSRHVAVAGNDKNIHLLEVATGKEIRSWPSGLDYVERLVFSPDGQSLAALSYQAVVAWSTTFGKVQLRLGDENGRKPADIYPNAVAFSPSGRVLAVGGVGIRNGPSKLVDPDNTGCIQLWDFFTAEKLGQIDGPQHSVTALTFAANGRTLASGGEDSTILFWDVTGIHKESKANPAPLTAAELDNLWADLGADGAKADRAIWALMRAGKQSVPFLSDRLRPALAADAKQVAKLIADLGSQTFTVRQKAMEALAALGEPAEAALRKVLDGNPNLEVRQRVELILEKRNNNPELIRRLRGIEALEHIGSLEARQALELLAKGAPNPRVGKAAAGALQRLTKN